MNRYFGAGMDPVFNGTRSLNPYEQNAFYNNSPFGNRRTFGPFDQFMMMAAGPRLYPLPVPDSTQSIYDAYWRRARDLELLRIRNNAVANMLPFKKLGGINQNNMLFNIGAAFTNQPDGFFANTMSPFIGGNPIKSQMALYANLRGLNMSTFGTTMDVTANDVGRLQDILYQNFYNQRQVGIGDLQSSQSALITAAKRRGVPADLLSRVRGMFTNSSTLDGTRYNNFKTEVDAVKDINRVLNTADLDSVEGKRKAKQAADAFLSSVSDETAKRKIREAITDSIKQGNANVFRSKVDFQNIDTLARQLEMHSQIRVGDTVPTSIKFKNTYGFSIEDLTSAFSGAAQMKLLGGKKDLFASAQDFFGGKSIGALDAARSLFGRNKTGKELMGDISEFLGASSVDFLDQSQATKFEKLARDIKALARNANIGLDTLKEIIAQAKAVAGNTSGLQNLGGMEIGQMVVDAGHKLVGLSSILDSGSIRRMGGTEGLMQSLVGGQLAKASEPVTLQLAALHNFYQNNPFAQQRVRQFASAGNLTQQNVNSFINNLARETGVNYYDLMSYATSNEMAAREGLRQAPELANVGAIATIQALRQSAFIQHGGGVRGQAALNSIDQSLSTKQVDLNAYMNLSGQDIDVTSRDLASQVSAGLNNPFLRSKGITNIEEFLNSDQSIRNQFTGLNTVALQLQSRLAGRIMDTRDVTGRLISSGNDSFLNKNGLVNYQGRVNLQGFAANPYFNVGNLAQLAQEAVQTGSVVSFLEKTNPGYIAAVKASRMRAQEEADMEQRMASQLGFLNAPTTTQFMDRLLSGKVSENGISDFLEPLGFSKTSSEFIAMNEAGKRVSAISSAVNFSDLSRGLKGAGVDMGGVMLQSLVKYAGKFGINADALRDISKSGKDKTAAIIARFSNQAVNSSDIDAIYAIAQQASKSGLADNYKGQFTFEGLRNFYSSQELQKFRDAIAAPQISELNKALGKQLGFYQSNNVTISPEQRAIANALSKNRFTNIESINKLMQGTGLDASGNVSSDIGRIAGMLGITGKNSQDVVNQVRGRIQSLDITKYADRAAAIREEVSNVGKSDSDVLKEMNDKMGNLPDMLQQIATAINNLTDLTKG